MKNRAEAGPFPQERVSCQMIAAEAGPFPQKRAPRQLTGAEAGTFPLKGEPVWVVTPKARAFPPPRSWRREDCAKASALAARRGAFAGRGAESEGVSANTTMRASANTDNELAFGEKPGRITLI